MLGTKRYEQAVARWIRVYNNDGIIGLRDTRKENSGRHTDKEITKDGIILRQEAKIKLLEEQVELLKKLDVIESRVVNNSVNLKGKEIFKLINETIINNGFKNMVSDFCQLLNVSRSGYYNKGSCSIKMILQGEFFIVYSRKKIQRIMKKYDIKCPIRKVNPYRRMVKATKEHRVVPNLLDRNFK